MPIISFEVSSLLQIYYLILSDISSCWFCSGICCLCRLQKLENRTPGCRAVDLELTI